MAELSLEGVTVRASSVLQRNVKQYGPRLALEEDPDTCWNSDQGTPQWLQLEFPGPVDLSSVTITFQGGFVGQGCRADVVRAVTGGETTTAASSTEAAAADAAKAGASGGAGSAEGSVAAASPTAASWHTVAEFEPDDLNRAQTFPCTASRATKLRLVFSKSTDFYGRVIVYRIQLAGKPSS